MIPRSLSNYILPLITAAVSAISCALFIILKNTPTNPEDYVFVVMAVLMAMASAILAYDCFTSYYINEKLTICSRAYYNERTNAQDSDGIVYSINDLETSLKIRDNITANFTIRVDGITGTKLIVGTDYNPRCGVAAC